MLSAHYIVLAGRIFNFLPSRLKTTGGKNIAVLARNPSLRQRIQITTAQQGIVRNTVVSVLTCKFTSLTLKHAVRRFLLDAVLKVHKADVR
jgi:hypothetical protein